MKNVKSTVIKVENYVTGKVEEVILRNKELFVDGNFSIKIKLGNKEFIAYDNPITVEIIEEIKAEQNEPKEKSESGV